MCVIGAGRRALRGETAAAILAQYYPGLEVASLPVGAARAASSISPAVAAVRRDSGITVTVPRSSTVAASELERMAARAHEELARSIGTSARPLTIRLHETLDTFRLATNRPWWVNEVAEGSAIDLAPASVLTQRGGVEASVRTAVAELLVARRLDGRPAWIRVGAARYFAKVSAAMRAASPQTRCPTDAELLLAVSASAQREAELRAEACFVRELKKTGNWLDVR